jgi:cell wall-associated NlpC family hydrolase
MAAASRLRFARRHGAALLVSAMVALPSCASRPSVEDKPRDWGTAAAVSDKGTEVALFALGLIDTGYRFGGKNPEAGLDCSGMVAYVYDKALGLKVSGSAASIARLGKPVAASRLKPGDLVFFNTRRRHYSHVGIYIGDGRFVHAPSSSSGRVRTDYLDSGWFARRFEGARAYFD